MEIYRDFRRLLVEEEKKSDYLERLVKMNKSFKNYDSSKTDHIEDFF